VTDNQSSLDARKRLQRGVKLLFILGLLFMVYILTDFSFNLPTPKSYQFKLPELEMNKPVLLKQESLIVVVLRYDPDTIAGYVSAYADAEVVDGKGNQANASHGHFVALGYGTLFGCPIEIDGNHYTESCSEARYDMLGRSLKKQRYPDLKIPQYSFNRDFSLLTIE
jgi:hypothetical protein